MMNLGVYNYPVIVDKVTPVTYTISLMGCILPGFRLSGRQTKIVT